MKRNKLTILMSCMLATSIILGGCSKEKTIIMDTEVQYDKNASINVTEETINVKVDDDQLYLPMYFQDNKIYGTFGLSGGGITPEGTEEYPELGLFKKNLYELKKDGELVSTDIQPMMYVWGEGSHGVIKNHFSKPEDENVYYYDNRTGEKRVIGNYNYEHERLDGQFMWYEQQIEGNSDYAYIFQCEESNEGVGEDKLLELQIINLKDNTKYTYKGDDISLLDEIVYSKIIEEFYAIDWTGKLYKLELNGNEVKFNKENEINLRGLFNIRAGGVSVNEDGEIVILNRHGDGETIAIIYNPKTKETRYINKNRDEDMLVSAFFPESNKVVLSKQNENKQAEIFIGELKNDSLKIYTKVNNKPEDSELSLFSSAIINEEGNKILVGTQMYTPIDNNVRNSRYVYNIITIE